jgi:hypothetical protein
MSSPVAPPSPPPRRRWKWYGPTMKVVRRVHMYLGLALFPWVALYGLTGVLFNHPDIGRGIERAPVSAARLTAVTGFQAWDPDAVARRVVEQLNRGAAQPYRLDDEHAPQITGWPILAAPGSDGGRRVLTIDLVDGSAEVAFHPPGQPATPAPFAVPALDVPEYRMSAVEAQVKDALPGLGVAAAGPLRAHPQVGPELRFTIIDAAGARWQATYDVRTGAVDGRRVDGDSGVRFVELLEKLHTTHHYPVHGDITWLWALLADITGITLVIWALTGLVMWWQMKPSRVFGAVAIAVAVIAASVVMTRTASNLEFGTVSDTGP